MYIYYIYMQLVNSATRDQALHYRPDSVFNCDNGGYSRQ